jgi:hypothetical protein
MLDHLFGLGQNTLLGSNCQSQVASNQMGNLANQMNPAVAQAIAQQQAFQQQMNAYNQNPFARTSQWVFAGTPCTIQEFADKIWPGEHEDKMLFILSHSGPKQK